MPAAQPGLGRGYEKAKFFERPAVAVGVELRVADGAVAAARVSVGSLTEVPMLVGAAAAALVGAAATDSAVAAAAAAGAGAFAELDVVDDLNGAAGYKRHLAGRLFERAAREALREASRNA